MALALSLLTSAFCLRAWGQYSIDWFTIDGGRGTVTLNPQLSTINVSWPSPSTGWNLQQNTNSVSSLNWSNVLTAPLDDGTTKTLIVNPPTGNRFYRLKYQP